MKRSILCITMMQSILKELEKRGGGLLIYVNENLTFRIREDLNVSDCDGEFLSVEIINSSSKNYIVTCCYRPPNSNVKKN